MTRPVTSTNQEAFFDELKELITASRADLSPGEVMGALILMYMEVGRLSEGFVDPEQLIADCRILLDAAKSAVFDQ